MKYRSFGNLSFDVSVLGFGLMRLPVLGGASGEYATNIDEEATFNLIHYAVEHGVTYFDTAYKYNDGKSEQALGKALRGGLRSKVKIATKLPVYLAKNPEDLEHMLETQLQRLETDYIDLYLLHNLSHMTWERTRELGGLELLDRAKQAGLIKYAGFSFHDGLHLFKEIIEAYDWDFCQIQLNYLDEHYQAGLEGLHYAREKGLAVSIMEPLRGGNLVKIVPDEVKKVWDRAPIKRSPAEWAFRWVANLPEVSVILSGMNSMEQLEENLAIFDKAEADSLTTEELQLIDEVKQIYQEKIKINCTQCSYCMPCPNGVYIRGIFNFYNEASLFNKKEEALRFYSRMQKAKADFSACSKCGRCEALCPQHLPIIELLREIDGEWNF